MTYEKIHTFFQHPQYENDRLEFKSFNQNKKLSNWYSDLAIEICAFLNSDGGILIWGAPQESKDQSGTRYSNGNLTPISPLDPDDLLRRIVGKIRDVPQRIQIRRLNNSNDTGSIYVFQIHTSEHRPHQAEDKYYMRIGGEKRAAPHHYIEAMMKQIKYPRIAGQLNFLSLRFIKKGHNSSKWWLRVYLDVIIENKSPFQNEESPRFILYCEHSSPLKNGEEWPTPQYPFNSSHHS